MGLLRRSMPSRDARGNSKLENSDVKLNSRKSLLYNTFMLRLTLGIFISGGFIFMACLGHVYLSALILFLIGVAYYEFVMTYDKLVQQRKQATEGDGASKSNNGTGKYKKGDRIYVITKALDILPFISLETFMLFSTMVSISFPWLLPRLAQSHPQVSHICSCILSYHHLLVFVLFFSGILKFIITLEKGRIRQQFLRFAFIVMALLYVVMQSMMVIANIYYGMIWIILPHTMISLNDVMAYFFGKMFGKTPLISLSPNKTLEGFIGAFISTTMIVAIMSPIILRFQPMICSPNTFVFTPFAWMRATCEPERIYKLTTYVLPTWLSNIVGINEILYRPCFVHIMILTLFASLFAPFGGFLASGFKRALKIKDFSDTIPGHGGMMDRFDCHILMGTFTYLYLKTFVRNSKYNADAVLKVITRMTPEDREILLFRLKEMFG
ncbi:Cytidylyltransferase family protein [Babesia bovis T2Bo]|uniref:Phosphatidate cytidylyltransferase n=1 Tax=Babesia bovis TaxID=5865 RepID=A7AU48_BABBO|nr:Cytidylyltransferase family protein [Babesia bovis T2Bo]EDO06459.1 Cytidylyltransferase family protein [Babesia bovis T2Bo]|eukprot:XP_001610027.1 cytidine diphosphate-diacylglycerol synthase [Babesia bovis T2Bo]